MINGQKICVVMPAYNAEKTLQKTYDEIPKDIVDEVILTDDASHDQTVEVAKGLGIKTFVHTENKGYGGNQKTCYQEALNHGADIVIMLHPDYQYTPKLITPMASMIAEGIFDAVIGSRILGNKAMRGGMPFYKYASNRFLTFTENTIIQQKLSEYHTGYRAFSRRVLEAIPLLENSDDFVFDNEMLCQTLYFGFEVGEVSCPALYFDDASSISFSRSVTYGMGVLRTSLKYAMAKRDMGHFKIFNPTGKKLSDE
ncbi:MAG: glycosyltransferase family 2 protein [Nitrospina sp.]|jgi:glycosyltransferase involved in cell wall biosynthesis|nr:glycosyltransferase family 2 protein [Nitrospina sp.]MBT6716602.1 glycosyltransferase family 2 protein [Nitrospina sp.]